ncbi:MAG: 2-oxoacid:ferredoxin oxidoreductase subunit gamma [Thermotoga sp. 4484_232]|nr:2-oxoacid:acceptor oxidoreductase family protein [Thermotogaceae bacterium]OQX57980.1 MAG: 2-oxoacid:ferredoxin oxidoreductase subunit gamma [Thermotoga sp. 4484_232]RKX38952.1 MAG: 2-oxoacid:ferredoxin oxidoreductase subunit gamma [Thermotogota bacterium]RKX53111.1 MAG: 2-oxoacid:ferredoxin oxidoreductase subunit gamma [Thermotoga sp.]RKX57347.1 MAG: 2-oxoacid:ferredoxin oxidoreductase subunit gamma [Thermotoga sp.]
MYHGLIIAGFGGQGVMLMGQVLAEAGMIEGKHVTWLPSYGPEMRGGTANCTVVISDEPVASPVIDIPTEVVVMNIPSLLKFEPYLKERGFLFMNVSVIDREPKRKDIEVIKVPANDIADKLGNLKVANMVMLGAYIAITDVVDKETVFEALKRKLKGKKADLLDINKKAILEGMSLVN